ncbi:MAG: glycosyltransferase family 4 protein [Deltaproteobacteria bacterium]|nr:glycosyltransferase family 4 protein [Deltaproteobacteria bacterium]
MKIALVSPYDFAHPGGVILHIAYLERYFTKMGHEVKVIAPASRAIPDFGDRFIPIGRPRPIPSSGSIARVTVSLWLAPRIRAVLEQEKFDIIHFHEPLMPMLCTSVLRLSHTANVGTFHASHGKPGYNFARPIGKWILRRWFRNLDGKIAVSKPAVEYARENFPGYYNIIPNGVDVEHFSPDVSPIEEFDDGKLNILFVSRLEKRKGLNYLLQAFKQVKETLPNCRLIVVGPGTRLRRRYERYVARSGLEDVVFVGLVSYDELPRYYKTADVFCAPAIGSESFGIILLEAMAMGKPIVASNIEGYASVVSHGVDGLLVPPADKDQLAQALIALLNDKALRQEMGARGRIKALEHSWERIARMVFAYYVRILREPPWNKKFPEFKETAISVK